ncbi:LysR family transcriptional regulator [Mesoterricola silvestris]|uniref:LysR family transcriptional regulator n=1 Tax=Mesoterricola silvestris TaxID=2927979 RepID=A0AA48H4R7_9BACT|nr:LysR family transcriptional regulator [Mesoterricola silvestris]BDU71853.1 LysR family transcriptional regulator [Mesoterricola silvestris]
MELQPLRMFVDVVRHGGFSRAAAVVHASQSTLSKAVKQLEDEFGQALLERLPRGIKLTAAGEVMHRRATTLLAQADDLRAELDELRNVKRGVLRLGVPFVGSDVLFAKPLAEFRRRYPGIEVQLTEHGSKKLEELVLAGELEVAASLLPVPEVFAWKELRREPIDLLVAADHLFAEAKSVHFKDVAEEPVILYAPGFALNPIILDACRRNHFTPKVIAQTSQVGFVMALVAAKLGVAFLPRMIASQMPNPATRCIRIGGPSIQWHMALIWRRDGFLPPAAKAWLDVVDGKT